MARPGEAVELPERRDTLRADGIQMEVADEFQQVGLLLHHDGLVAILEEMPHTFMAPVEGAGIAGEEGPHAARQGTRPRPDEEMGMVRQEGPGIHGPGPPLGQGAAPGEKVRPVRVVAEDRGALDPPHHHMVEGLGRVEPGLAWHVRVKASTT